jgi:hypothetical protein
VDYCGIEHSHEKKIIFVIVPQYIGSRFFKYEQILLWKYLCNETMEVGSSDGHFEKCHLGRETH